MHNDRPSRRSRYGAYAQGALNVDFDKLAIYCLALVPEFAESEARQAGITDDATIKQIRADVVEFIESNLLEEAHNFIGSALIDLSEKLREGAVYHALEFAGVTPSTNRHTTSDRRTRRVVRGGAVGDVDSVELEGYTVEKFFRAPRGIAPQHYADDVINLVERLRAQAKHRGEPATNEAVFEVAAKILNTSAATVDSTYYRRRRKPKAGRKRK